MQMEIKKVKCPQCGQILQVKNSKDEDVKSFFCPSCNASLSVRFHEKEDKSRTRIPNELKKSISLPFLISTGQIFQLSIGRNIVGRKADSSVADIQIKTDDRLISRHHALITVGQDPSGRYCAKLTNYKNKNLTRVNGLDIVGQDEVILEEGSTILMGATVITFTFKPLHNE